MEKKGRKFKIFGNYLSFEPRLAFVVTEETSVGLWEPILFDVGSGPKRKENTDRIALDQDIQDFLKSEGLTRFAFTDMDDHHVFIEVFPKLSSRRRYPIG